MLTIWLAITVIAIIIEILTIDLVSIWFAAGSIVALIAYLLNASTTIQIALFVIVTSICAIIIRPISKKYLRGNIERTNFDRVIGKHGLVTKTITA
ncbi:NfeD family protein, partial [Thomasclavelia spiroformis]